MAGSAVPAAASVVGTLRVTTDPLIGPKAPYTVTSPWQMNAPGFYTAVWSVSAADQVAAVVAHTGPAIRLGRALRRAIAGRRRRTPPVEPTPAARPPVAPTPAPTPTAATPAPAAAGHATPPPAGSPGRDRRRASRRRATPARVRHRTAQHRRGAQCVASTPVRITSADQVDSWGCQYGVWRSLVARFVRDEEAAGSNPVTPTSERLRRKAGPLV